MVITEQMPYVRSVSVGVWIRAGSRREPAELNGISHFMEHMVFKGTERRTAQQIAREIDSVGGMLDAFTAQAMVCFNAKALAEHLTPALAAPASTLALAPAGVRLAGNSLRTLADQAIFGIAFAGVLYSAYLTYIELFVLRKICPWCVASAAIVTLISSVSSRPPQPSNRFSERKT